MKTVCLQLGLGAAIALGGFSPAIAQNLNEINLDQIGTRDINSSYKPMVGSVDEELVLGRQISREYEQSVTLNDDPGLQSLLDRVTQTLVQNSDAHIPVHVRVIESGDINVSILPGGYVYVTTGLVRASATEAELASAVSFGVASVAARHAMERRGRASFINFVTQPAPPTGDIAGLVLAQAASVGIPAGLLSSARREVLESDFLAVQYLYKAGYDPKAAITLLQTIEARSSASSNPTPMPAFDSYAPVGGAGKQTLSSVFATHPSFTDRIERIEQLLLNLPPREQDQITTKEFDDIQESLSR